MKKLKQQQKISVSSKNFDPLPWSYTKLNSAHRCSLACYLSCTRARGKAASKHPNTLIGKYIHKLAEIFIKGGETTLTLPPNFDFPVRYFETLALFFKKYLPLLKESIGTPYVIIAEKRIRLDSLLLPVVEYKNAYITGVIDLLLYNPSTKALILLDYKTGNLTDAAKESVSNQLKIYSLLVHRGLFPVKTVERIVYPFRTGECVWLSDDVEVFNEHASISYLKDFVTSAITKMQDIKPYLNPLCPYCDHRDICPIYEDGDENI